MRDNSGDRARSAPFQPSVDEEDVSLGQAGSCIEKVRTWAPLATISIKSGPNNEPSLVNRTEQWLSHVFLFESINCSLFIRKKCQTTICFKNVSN